MAETYLRRLEVGYPPQSGNAIGTYSVKFFTNEDLGDLQDEANNWMVGLPQTTSDWTAHIIDTQYDHFISTQGQPTITHVLKITLFLVGNITTTPQQVQS